MRKCIFYLPYQLNTQAERARMVRPRKMIQAFRDIGYDVFVIQGYAKERRLLIQELKRRISAGEVYDFMYAESSTMPTLLTEPHHYPTHPFLDFGFFRYLKRKNIKIGLFYPDIYWKFDDLYGNLLPRWKKYFAIMSYKYDVWQYERLLDKFYIPGMKMFNYLDSDKLRAISEELPPGADNISMPRRSYQDRDFGKDSLQIFYVGGLGGQYDFLKLVEVVASMDKCEMTICCRESDWEREKENFVPYLNNKIHVIHKSGEGLELSYQKADICCLLFHIYIYREMAKPVKAFEYLGHELPVLSSKGSGVSSFVEESGIGWNIDYDVAAIRETLENIIANPKILEEKHKNCVRAKQENLWTCRAMQVRDGLMNFDLEILKC